MIVIKQTDNNYYENSNNWTLIRTILRGRNNALPLTGGRK